MLAAFLMEVVLIAIAVPLSLIGYGSALVYVIPPACLIVTFAITVWVGRTITSRFVLHGAMIGVVGTLMYVALTRAEPEPWQYLLAHGLKVAGGIMAGVVLARRAQGASAAPPVQD